MNPLLTKCVEAARSAKACEDHCVGAYHEPRMHLAINHADSCDNCAANVVRAVADVLLERCVLVDTCGETLTRDEAGVAGLVVYYQRCALDEETK